ncbi:homeobox protein BEL1 homolog [Vicia villosa]|uniref:homeobox protein BEL1 homolog n=1 Tax=Vicia villosa TaxID=3911 RepID=UPI00273CDB9F|nr:homeobox protein BEL1 homolog [Vicia villosa]
MARQLCEDEKTSSGGFCYNPQIQGFVSDPEMFNLTTGMEMIGFSKHLHHQQHHQQQQHSTDTNMWKTNFSGGKLSQQHVGPSPSYHHHPQQHHHHHQDFTVSETTSNDHQNLNMLHHHQQHQDSSSSSQWQQVDDSSLRCVFPCEGNERPSQGLSLSLSSTNPSSLVLQSFELRNTHQIQDQGYQGHFLLKNSKFLLPAQQLLNELCSLESTKQNDLVSQKQKSQKFNNKQNFEEENTHNGSTSSSIKHSLTSVEFVELQKRKTKLLSMLEEVDRRYKNYCNQMKSVVSTFEGVAGNGAAKVYSALALKAMSRHFRCLKDGIMEQIERTRKTMGEKDPIAPGTTKGETPRLKILDRVLRQQRAFQQINIMETHPWRPQRGLPERSVSVLRAWLFEHFLHPYPSDVDKHILARQTGLSRSQVSNWFINARVRLWKPMVEEMYLEEEKEQQRNTTTSEGGNNLNHEEENLNVLQDQSPTQHPHEDQKPRLLRIDSECVSSIINNDHKNEANKNLHHHHDQLAVDAFGSVDIDFSSYNRHHSSDHMVGAYPSESFHHGGGGGGGGVSLTLGLQQHGGNGVSLAFPSTNQSPMFYTRDQIEEPVQYSLLDGEGTNIMPYRNLMGTQLLHDLA